MEINLQDAYDRANSKWESARQSVTARMDDGGARRMSP
jgi:hypothetical protein